MRKFLSIFLLLFATSVVSAQGMEFFDGTWSEALKKAKKENKLVFLDCYSAWCGPCSNMAKNIFPLKEVGDLYNANFINVKYNMEVDFGIVLCKRYNIVSYPTLLYVNPEGFVVEIGAGFRSAEDFIALGKSAIAKKGQPTRDERFNGGERESSFLEGYLGDMVYIFTPQTEKAISVLDKLFTERGGKLFNDKIFWDTYAKCANDINSSVSLYVVQNRKELAKKYGEYEVNAKIRDLYTNFKRIFSLCSGPNISMKPDPILVEEHCRLIRSRELPDAQGVIDEVNFLIYARIEKDMEKAVKHAEKALKNADGIKLYHWSERANVLFRTRELRDVAASWAQRALPSMTDEEMKFNCEFVLNDLKTNLRETRTKGGRKK